MLVNCLIFALLQLRWALLAWLLILCVYSKLLILLLVRSVWTFSEYYTSTKILWLIIFAGFVTRQKKTVDSIP